MKNSSHIITAERSKRDPKWVKGTIGTYTFEAVVFDEGSSYGIDEGRVSKLWVWGDEGRRNEIFAYDRGWDRKPKDAHKVLFQALLQHLEALPID